jgi:hypothetical protein
VHGCDPRGSARSQLIDQPDVLDNSTDLHIDSIHAKQVALDLERR